MGKDWNSTGLPMLRMYTAPDRHRHTPMGTPTIKAARKNRVVIMVGLGWGGCAEGRGGVQFTASALTTSKPACFTRSAAPMSSSRLASACTLKVAEKIGRISCSTQVGQFSVWVRSV